jgi:glutamate synthase domain-containing protein 2/glutamate synthase domain-containing protein 1/glutamate synthase domain-containing protein 3
MTRRSASVDHDACGVGFVAQLGSTGLREVVERALEALRRLGHRGGLDADGRSGDGAGLLTAISDKFVRSCAREAGIELPSVYALGMAFLPREQEDVARHLIAKLARDRRLQLLGWRAVPTDPSIIGPRALDTLPVIQQCFFAPVEQPVDLELDLFKLRKEVESRAADGIHFCSLSSRTVVYKGLLTPEQLPAFYSDLAHPDFASPFAIFHQRYSTNTNPSWSLAQPFRFVAHNGEINTISANRRWLRAKEVSLRQTLGLPATVRLLEEYVSDSASFDNGLEIFLRRGYNPAAAMWCMVPPAQESDPSIPSDFQSFLEAHAREQEPWDGPAALIFTDGFTVGAKLDRNGLRPLRYTLTADGLLVAGSEVGIVDLHDKKVIERQRLGPGEMLVVDPAKGRFLRPGGVPELGEWHQFVSGAVAVRINPSDQDSIPSTSQSKKVLAALGWSEDQFRLLFQPLIQNGQEAVWSMGDDAPSAFLSSMRRPLWEHCKQRFAQVTNPPIDPLREAHVMSLDIHLHDNWLLPSPLLDSGQLQVIQEKLQPAEHLDFTFRVADGIEGAKCVLKRLEEAAIAGDASLVLLSDRGVNADKTALPALLALAAVWKSMVKAGGWSVPLIIETGQVVDTHHLALLIAAGASAVMPYAALEQAARLRPDGVAIYRLAVEKGLRKVMARMGISTVASYRNSQLFETIGLDEDLRANFFEDAGGALGGKGRDELLEDCIERHVAAFKTENSRQNPELRDLGLYRFRHEGERHATSPELVRRMHRYIKSPSKENYQAFAGLAEERVPVASRDLLEIAPALPVPLQEVESEASILSRFSTQAMSLGAISPETHRTLAIAMNRLGARSNTGEGGEDPEVYGEQPEANNRVKQVASARFGVTTEYLVHADELEIKIAQGAKPGEGGQLPAGKVTAYIARLRHSVPNTMLISPPPHHDIYSIEDLEQLIYDLRAVNPSARIGVKLVSSTGVGIVATGVAKAGADVITISGHDGGTGASSLTSIKSTGLPWEIGLRDAHRSLVRAGLRRRVRLRVDGGFKFGRDVILGALLGADEFGFGTAALLALGCVMARQCHLNTCPVGIATQDEKLRMRFTGKPEMVESYFRALAGEVRERLAAMGACSIDAIVGAVDRLRPRNRQAGRALAELLEPIAASPQTVCLGEPGGVLQLALRRTFKEQDTDRSQCFHITNADRAVGAHLSGEILRLHSEIITPVDYDFIGTAGQSFGAFLIPGINLRLFGEANDYVGKGLSGGSIAITAGEEASRRGDVLAGNTVLYGATSGELYIAGRAGERFAVRNSGALAVVEGVGQHACEYMTAGVAVILGPSGINLGAGMTGGLAYLLRDSVGGRVHNDQSVRIVPIELEEELWLRRVLRRHKRLTGSPPAAQLLRSEQALQFSRVEPLSLPCSIRETWDAILKRFGRQKAQIVDVSRVIPLDGLSSYQKQRALVGNR